MILGDRYRGDADNPILTQEEVVIRSESIDFSITPRIYLEAVGLKPSLSPYTMKFFLGEIGAVGATLLREACSAALLERWGELRRRLGPLQRSRSAAESTQPRPT